MKPLFPWVVILSACTTTPVTKAPAPAPNPTPIAAFAIVCQSIRGPIPQSIYIVLTKELAIHWTKTGVTVMELDRNGIEQDTEMGQVPFESILALAKTADIVDELKLGYGCDVVTAGNPL